MTRTALLLLLFMEVTNEADVCKLLSAKLTKSLIGYKELTLSLHELRFFGFATLSLNG